MGIGWVVECIEQRAQVDETNFLIDLEHTNVAGHHKVCDSLIVNIALLICGRFQRRRSILPRLFAEEETGNDSVDGDRSMDGSVSCKSHPSTFFLLSPDSVSNSHHHGRRSHSPWKGSPAQEQACRRLIYHIHTYIRIIFILFLPHEIPHERLNSSYAMPRLPRACYSIGFLCTYPIFDMLCINHINLITLFDL